MPRGRQVVFRGPFVPMYARRARRLGVPVDDLLADGGFPPDSADVEEITTALEPFRAFTGALAKRADDVLFGAHEAMDTPRGAFGVLEYVVRNAPTLRELILQLVRFGELVNPYMEFALDETTGVVSERILGEPDELGKETNEYSIVHQLKIARDVTGIGIVPERVFFAHRDRAGEDELARFFGTRAIEYGAGFSGARLPRAVLDAPVAAADAALFRVLEERAREIAADLSKHDDLEPIRRAIAHDLRDGEPSAKRTARTLGMSERSLSRALAASGTSFRAIVDELRHGLAVSYLGDPARSVTEVAIVLGYSDARAFTRAFLRWTGKSPAQFRAARTRR